MTTHVRRLCNGSGNFNFAPYNDSRIGHPEETQIVIDWITLSATSAAGATVDANFTDNAESAPGSALPGQLYRLAITLPPDSSDTVHVTFPYGFPIRRYEAGTIEYQDDTSTGPALASNRFTVTVIGPDSWEMYIGYHYERMSLRR